jgi:hypothetical protein
LDGFLSSISFGNEFFKSSKSNSLQKKAAFKSAVIINDSNELNDDISVETKEKKERKKQQKSGFFVDEPVLLSLGHDQEVRKWSLVEEENGAHLLVEINMDHPTFKNENEIEVFIRNSVLDSIAEFIVKEEKKYNDVFEDEIDRLNTVKDLIVRHSAQLI